MISIVLSKSVDKSNTKYYDVVIKWVNITTSAVNIYKIHTLYYNLVIKWLNVTTNYYYIITKTLTLLLNSNNNTHCAWLTVSIIQISLYISFVMFNVNDHIVWTLLHVIYNCYYLNGALDNVVNFNLLVGSMS